METLIIIYRNARHPLTWVDCLHEGVKFGCQLCAESLQIEFDHPFDLADMLAPHIDKARGERYGMLGDALGFDPSRRFPNLDQILPLPPAALPDWNGKRDTLLNAAMGVKPKPLMPKPSAASLRTDRHFLDAEYRLRYTGDKTSGDRAPREGYWQPTGDKQPEYIRSQLEKIPPALYRADEGFNRIYGYAENSELIFGVVWERWDTQWNDDDAVMPRAVAGLIREVDATTPMTSCRAGRACPATGVWQPWLSASHPLCAAVNQHWRQTWLIKGQPFPRPEHDWLLPLPELELTWYLMDAIGVKLT